MSTPASDLPELVEQLGRTFSPFERLKILGRAWSLLRRMTPQERLIVAAQLGLDHADELVESIAARGGSKASPVIISMIDQAQKKGTAHLPELIADLKDPSKRAERLRQGAAAAVEGALAGDIPAAPWLPAGLAEPKAALPPPLPTPAADAKPEVVALEVPAPAPLPAVSAPPPEPVPVLVVTPVPAPPPAPEPLPAPVVAVPILSAPPPVRPAEPPRSAAPPEPEEGDLSLMDRFRRLRREADGAKGLSASRVRPLVEAFPDGWARRRALSELLRAGAPAAVGDALDLIGTLGSERDRLWCLGTLAESRALDGPDREALLAAAPSPTARRRLERRLS